MKTNKKTLKLIAAACAFALTVLASVMLGVNGINADGNSIRAASLNRAGYFSSADEISVENDYSGDGGNGVAVTLNTKGKSEASFNYLNYIKTSELPSFLEIGFSPVTVGESDFDYVVFTLTDAENDSQKLSYIVMPQPESSGWWYSWTTSAVAFTDNLTPTTKASYQFATVMQITGTSQNACGRNTTLTAVNPVYETTYQDSGFIIGEKNKYFVRETETSVLKTFSLGFSANQALIAGKVAADITDETFLSQSSKRLAGTAYENLYTADYAKNLFSSGYATLSVRYYNVKTDSVTCYVTKIGGQTIANNAECDVADAEPYMRANIVSNAVKGVSYTLPAMDANNFIDGDLKENASVSVYDSQGIELLSENGKITFTEEGVYTLAYSVTDGRNNEYYKNYEIVCFSSTPLTSFSYEGSFDSSYTTGDSVKIPVATAYSDLSVEPDSRVGVTTLVQRDGVVVAAYEDLSRSIDYTLTQAGEYQIAFLHENAFGQIQTAYEQFTVTPGISIAAGAVPVSFTAGKAVKINDFGVVNYVNDEGFDKIYRAVYVNGTLLYLAKGKNVLEGSTVVPANSFTQAGTALLTYKAGFDRDDLPYEKTFKIPVIKPVYISDYIIPLNGDGVYDNDGVTATNAKDSAVFVTSRDKTFSLPQVLPADSLNFSFGTDSGNADFKSLVVRLIDATTGKSVSLALSRVNEETSLLTVNGKTSYGVAGSLINDENYFVWRYEDKEKALYDESGKIAGFTEYADGTAFKGFSGGIILRFEVSDVSGAGNGSVRIINVLNQSFGSVTLGGNAQPHNDVVSPVIVCALEMENKTMNIASFLNVSAATAYDVLDCTAEVKVSVYDPSGNKILNEVSCEKTRKILLSSFGQYRVVYTANDGNTYFTTSNTYIYTVKDLTPPTIYVSGTVQSEATSGETVVFPTATVFDNYTENCKFYVLVYTPDGERVVTDGKYTFTKAGEFRVVYYAYDDNYNVSQTTFKVTVK